MKNTPVDAVITWVDGTDPEHNNRLTKHLSTLGITRPESAIPTRFNQRGEIKFCIDSIIKFAPWIRNIYIITDKQIPKCIPKDNKIKIIDHTHIFKNYEQYLPTFNSLSIETMLWRIDNLANNFIYFNDDCILLRPVCREDFFKNNKIILRGEWKTQHHAKLINKLGLTKKIPSEHRLVQENSAKLAGMPKKFFHLPHIPFALQKTLFEQYFQKNPEQINQQLGHAFRSLQQFWPISLVYHLAIKKNQILIKKNKHSIALHASYHTFKEIQQKLKYAKSHAKFICIQSLDEASVETYDFLIKWLNHQLSF